MPLISVIMACHNAVPFIESAIESIVHQTHKDFQLIIIDDASSDNSLGLLRKKALTDSRIELYALSENVGAGAARNIGISKSRGDWLAIMDADDISFPDRFAQQVAFLVQNPEVDVVGAVAIEMDCDGKHGKMMMRRETHDAMVQHIYTECPFNHSTVMAKKAFFVTLYGYDETFVMRRVEDYDLWLRGYKQFRYHNLQVPLVYYRRGQRPKWHDAIISSRVIWNSICRDKKPLYYVWYVLRPLIATLFVSMKLR
jgi:glycosyltransferase involved in cell wall biosynthesis